MSAVAAFFSGHPLRIAGAAALAVVALAAAWYLGSPLFIRTYADEALPPAVAAAPSGAATAPAAASPGASAAPAAPTAAGTPASGVLLSGQLGYVDALHNGTGEVRVVAAGSQRFLRFESVAITNAPDIHVYLSRDTGGRYVEANSLYLGTLKATNGSFNYEVPASADVSGFRSVVVWCRNFATLITWADLR